MEPCSPADFCLRDGVRRAVPPHWRTKCKTGASTDARAQGVTLARIHAAAENYAGGKAAHYRLDLDHLLHRQVAAVMGIKRLATKTQEYLSELASRLSASVAAAGHLSWTLCHGDCHGGNARIAEDGPRAGQAIFFDFDDGGPGYLAYDLAVYLWANAFLQRELAMWHAFIDGYRSIRSITAADFDALHLFVPIRHIWLMGEYAGRIAEWGSEAVPVEWLAKQADLLGAWRMRNCPPDSCNLLPGKLVGRAYPSSIEIVAQVIAAGAGARASTGQFGAEG